MYKSVDDETLYNDINQRKEFVYLQGSEPTTSVQDDFFEFTAPQQFVRNYFNPRTPYRRMLIKHGTGLGKTNTALLVAKEFLAVQRPVIIIGFTIERFKTELLKYPIFGYVTDEEVKEQNRLFKLTVTNDPEHVKNYKDYITKLKRRLRDFQFYGYKEFNNRIFDIKGAEDPKLNINLIDSFRHGVIICDEIHNAYNSIEQNNWGKAIQFVLNVLGPDIHCALMSATPINNPNEINDLLSLLNETKGIPINTLLSTPQELYKELVDKTIAFNAGELTEDNIMRQVRGKVSFMPDIGMVSLPKRVIEGDAIPSINYLRFKRCVMSDIHYKACDVKDPVTGTVIKHYYLRDVGFDVPEGYTDLISFLVSETDESYKWKRDRGIYTELTASGLIFSGPFMKRESLIKYSTKYVAALDDIISSSGKVLVYHHVVRTTGVLFIQNMLKENGVIGDNEYPDEHTLCSVCSRRMGDAIHKEGAVYVRSYNYIDPATEHTFVPMRFLIVYSDIEKTLINKIIDKYNARTNVYGYDYKILIGSRVIREGYDIKAVQNLVVMSLPINIPTLLQVFGRAVRTRSHEHLPPEKRVVRVRIYTSTYPRDRKDLSYEEQDYKNKIDQYVTIQKYERALNRSAIDAHIMNTPELIKKNLHEQNLTETESNLGALLFSLPDIKPDTKKTTTYYAMERFKDELNTIITLIEYHISTDPTRKIWKYGDLWNAIHTSEGTPNPRYFDIKNFAVAVNSIKRLSVVGEYVIISDKLDIESFTRPDYITEEIITFNAGDIKLKAIINDINSIYKPSNKLLDIIPFYESYSIDSHLTIIRRSIEFIISKGQIETVRILGSSINQEIAHKIIKFYKLVFTFVTAEELRQTHTSGIIGYRYGNTIHYFTNQWNTTISIEDEIKENPAVIGMYAPNMLFKLRDPVTYENNQKIELEDRRKVPRGAVCSTKTKQELTKIIKKLGIKMDKSRVRNLCDVIKMELLKREQDRVDGLKWFYLY